MIIRLPNTNRYHSVNLTRMLLNIREVGDLGRQHIALTASRMNQRLIRALINLASETLDINIDDIGKGIEVLIPNVLGDLLATEDLTLMKHQQLKQGILFRGEFDDVLAAFRLVVHGIERKISNAKHIIVKLSVPPQ